MAKTRTIKLPMQFGVLLLSTSGLMGCALSDELDHVDSTTVKQQEAVAVSVPKVATLKQHLSADQVYRVLAAESLVSKGQVGAAARVYLDLVERYASASMAQRAYDLAIQSGSKALLSDASRVNATHNPDFIESWQVQVVLQLRAGQILSALDAWESFYQHSRAQDVSERDIFLSTSTLAQDDLDLGVLLDFSEKLTQRHPSPYAEFSHIMLMVASGEFVSAFDRLELVNQRYPEQPELAQLTASLAIKLANGRGVDWLKHYCQTHPNDFVVSEQLGRVYVVLGRLDDARTQFQQIIQRNPAIGSVNMSLALVGLELKQPQEAEALLLPLTNDKRYADMARYYLGQALYFQDRIQEAAQVWALVLQGEYRVDALIWRAQILSKQNKLDEAQTLLAGFNAVDEGEQIRVLRARIRVYLLQKQPQQAIRLLDKALLSMSDDGALWQERADIKLEAGDEAGFEQDIRHAIMLTPNDADMLNALGYYLADRHKQLIEARQLIEKADHLSPNKHYINDSLGWLAYQEGNLVQAEHYLSKAYRLKNDPEILRHWLVVLLAQGNKLQAQALIAQEAPQFHDDDALSNFLRQMSLAP